MRRCLSFLLVGILGGCTTLDLYSEEGRQQLERVSLRVDTFDVEVQSRDELIWQGTVQVNRMNSSRIAVDRGIATGQKCTPLSAGGYSQYKMEFIASKWGGNAVDPDSYEFRGSIWRLAFERDCKTPIVRESMASRSLRMVRGQRIDLEGEDGFKVAIIRRR